jgi:CO/xanthine dehydrogenase FAD-binding subunit
VKALVPDYELVKAKNLDHALELLGDWKPFAGGTDLMVLFESGKLPHKRFVNIWALPELKGIEETADYVTLGALTTYTQVQAHPALRREFPMLCQAARETGGIATQNRGTLGGNIANASPAADSPPALLAYDAELELVSARGSCWVPYHGFHTGYKQMILREDELVRRIRLPRVLNRRHYYRKVGTRRAQAISKVCFAGVARIEGDEVRDIRIALGSVAPTVIRCLKTETLLTGQKLRPDLIEAAKAQLAKEIIPINDMRSTAHYRLRVAGNLLQEFLT